MESPDRAHSESDTSTWAPVGRKSRETDQGLRHAQDQKCRDNGCTVNPFQFTVQRFKVSFNLEWSTKQASFEMN
ncbi:hypothetical protein TIFTF001_033884 [Ficus carica]|uniref:Uncharacterized protein n=1 Tax=Ficus carica TaxID=3494 RepID=A0AA88DZC4_FICCA|nr:hypothetical protein TIFTF001_033884 [Ficus carica]